MHSVQFCRQLACLFDRLYVEMNQEKPRIMTEQAKDELLLLSCELPMHWLDLRLKVSGQVYATDASPEGGGACSSTSLSPWGNARLQSMSHETEGLEGGGTRNALVVECFAGMGGLKQALDLLGFEPAGVIAIDNSPECSRIYRQHCRHAILIQDITTITEAQVIEWRRRFPKVTQVILAGGWPCVNHSLLNVHRQGAEGATSKLLDGMLQIRQWLKECSRKLNLPEWNLVEMYENVVMDDGDFKVQTKKISFLPYFMEAAQLGRCRRPRLYWLSGVDIIPGDDLKVLQRVIMRGHEYHVKEVRVDTERLPLEWFLEKGASKMKGPEDPSGQPCWAGPGLRTSEEKMARRQLPAAGVSV